MSRKTRRLIWSAPLMAVLAVVGALAIFAVATPGGVFANPAPGAITDFTVSVLSDDPNTPEKEGRTAIKLSWSAPESGTAPDAYRIDWAPAAGHQWHELVARHDGTEYVDRGLQPKAPTTTPNVTRYYRVFAINGDHVGPESDILQETTDDVVVPDAVTGLNATADSSDPTKIRVRWTAPTDTGGLPITGYKIVGGANAQVVVDRTATAGTGDVTLFEANTNSTATTYTHEKLTAKTKVYYAVYAINKVGTSAVPSNVDSATTKKAARPDRPTNLLAVDSGSGSVNLYWLKPEENGGRPITEYVVQVSPDNGNNWREFTVSNAEGTTDQYPTDAGTSADYVHVPGDTLNIEPVSAVTPNIDLVTAETKLRYRIYAKHEDGRSLVSREARVEIGATNVPTRPTSGPVMESAGSIKLRWMHAAGVDTGYRIDVSDEAGEVWEELELNTGLALEFPGGTSHVYNDGGLEPGTMRLYRVFTNDGGIFSLPTTPIEGEAGPAEQPSNPRGLTATAVNAGQINLNWSAPEKDGGTDIRRYLVEVSSTGTAWTAIIGTAGLSDGTGGAVVGTGFVWVTKRDANDRVVTSYEHKGLPHDQRYHYRVRADNSENDAGFTADNPTTLTAEADALTQTAKTPRTQMPAAPMMLSSHPAADSSLSDPGDKGVYLTWLASADPPGAKVQSYDVQRRIQGEDDLLESVLANRTFYNDTEDLSDQVRHYRIAARNAAGRGDWTGWVTYPLDPVHMHTPVVGPEVGPATGVTTGPFNEGGVTQVNWDAAPNATGYIIYAVNVDELDDADGQVVVAPVNDAAAETFNLGGLNVGDTYDIYVVATAKEMVAWPADADVEQVEAE